MKIALIHGYAVDMEIGILRRRLGRDAGFAAFRRLLDSGDAVLFRWAEHMRFSSIHYINPFAHLRVYNVEKNKAVSDKLHQEFSEFLDRERPDTLVCHSMGSYLLMNYINKFGLPDFIRKVVFVQGDIPAGTVISNPDIIKRLENKELAIYNYYCWWDITLISSMILNRYVPLGLTGSRLKHIHNRFFPLYKKINLHQSSMNDDKLIELIMKD